MGAPTGRIDLMQWIEEKTKEQIYSQLLGEMRYWCPEIPESSERLDPVVRLLLGVFASQMEKLNQKINFTWKQTFRSLVKNVLTEGLRWPMPAATVIQIDPTDDGVEVEDPAVLFLYKDDKEQRNFLFSPREKTKLVKAELTSVLYSSGQDLLPLIVKSEKEKGKTERKSGSFGETEKLGSSPSAERALYLSLRYNGPASAFSRAPLFFLADEDTLRQVRWGKWYLSSSDGYFFEENSFCPGARLQSSPKILGHSGNFGLWGGMSLGEDLYKELKDGFFYLPTSLLTSWDKCLIPSDLQRFQSTFSLQEQSTSPEKLFWIKIKLPESKGKNSRINLKEVSLNCLVAINKKTETVFKHTGGNQLLEIELPGECSTILTIDSVTDSNQREYHNKLDLSSTSPFAYSTEERNGRLVLWFDFTTTNASIPNSISVSYSFTYGSQANGIEAGKIDQMWERHPGIRSVTNILPTVGGMPAKSQEELHSQISSLLRNRGRAVSFQELEHWTSLFDSRITATECKNIVKKGAHGAVRCTQVNVRVSSGEFYSEDELKVFKKRLERFLKERSLINTSIEVNILAA
jgi:hypothetical protein